MNKNSNPLCPACRKRTRSLGSYSRHPDANGGSDMYECWTEDCPYMGVEALPHHWKYLQRQMAIMEAQRACLVAYDWLVRCVNGFRKQGDARAAVKEARATLDKATERLMRDEAGKV